MEIRIIRNLKELEGTCYFEFLSGPYKDKCWLPDSVYISEDAFDLIEPIFNKRIKKFDHFAFNEATSEEIQAVCKDLDTIFQQLNKCENISQLENTIKVGEQATKELSEDFDQNLAIFKIMVKELTEWLKQNAKEKGVISILGM